MLKKVFYASLVSVVFISCSKNDDITSNPVVQSNTTTANDPCTATLGFLVNGKKLTYETKTGNTLLGTMELKFGQCSNKGFEFERKIYKANGVLNSSSIEYMKEDNDYLLASNDGLTYFKGYKKNCVAGDSWQYTKGTAVITYTVLSVNQVLTVPAGTYTCKIIKYTNSENINESTIHWNDQVGFVQEDNQLSLMKLKSVN